jgi:hypothetical protein
MSNMQEGQYVIILLIVQFNTHIAGNFTLKLQIAEEDSISDSLANSKYIYVENY